MFLAKQVEVCVLAKQVEVCGLAKQVANGGTVCNRDMSYTYRMYTRLFLNAISTCLQVIISASELGQPTFLCCLRIYLPPDAALFPLTSVV